MGEGFDEGLVCGFEGAGGNAFVEGEEQRTCDGTDGNEFFNWFDWMGKGGKVGGDSLDHFCAALGEALECHVLFQSIC